MTQESVTTWCAEARALGIEHAQNAAGWSYDGNSDPAERANVLAMLRDGDPAAWDYLPPEPNLSGEWAGDLTPGRLFEDITREEAMTTADGDVVEALADAYEDGVRDTFSIECERALIAYCEPLECEQ